MIQPEMQGVEESDQDWCRIHVSANNLSLSWV